MEACLHGPGFLVGDSLTVMPSHLENLPVISDMIVDRADRIKAALPAAPPLRHWTKTRHRTRHLITEEATNPDFAWMRQEMFNLGWIDENERHTLGI